MKFTQTATVRWHDTDANRTVRPSALLVLMQECAGAHLAHFGLSLETLRDRDGLAFLLSKIKILFHEPLYAYEEVTVETFTIPCRGYAFHRGFRILRGETLIAEALSVWALLDLNSKALVRREAFSYGFEDDEPLDFDLPRRIALPVDDLRPLGERRIVYSDLDYNMHMNNTHYPDMLCDFLPLEESARLSSMTLSFLREAPFGATLRMMGAEEENTRYFRTLGEDGLPCLDAEVVLR